MNFVGFFLAFFSWTAGLIASTQARYSLRVHHTHDRRLHRRALSSASTEFPGVEVNKTWGDGIPIVYVFTVVANVCKHGFPEYIRTSLEQAAHSQPDAHVIIASNFGECPVLFEQAFIRGVERVDTTQLTSNRTRDFLKSSGSVFQSDNHAELWLTSALRFLIMEDIMVARGYDEMIHVEADNMLYGNLTSILPVLRKKYRGLAATPLNDNVNFITASVFWISHLSSLQLFNNFLLQLGNSTTPDSPWKKYLAWLRKYACCKHGGVDQDEQGMGIKPFAINEMSMLAFYHKEYPLDFHLFPVVPKFNYFKNRYVCNMSEFGPGGSLVGPPTGDGVWDPNSWGQYLGGTHFKKGRDKKFTDPTHIIGQAIRLNSGCRPEMVCANKTFSAAFAPPEDSSFECVTAPFVRCSDDDEWVPLWNLHVHSKHTHEFRSKHCACNS